MESKHYSYDEAYDATLKYFGGDELAARVWVSKYALKDSFGNIYELTPDDMHHRIASEIARIESKYPNPMNHDEVFGYLKDFKYIVPQGSPMSGIGNSYQVGSLSNCFVIGLDGAPDSYGGVIRIDEEQVQLMKRRGGVGHDLSHIRPKGTPVKNSALTSTGLVPFMERYSNSTREVAQDGRRGALMLTVSIKHPDSEAFVDAKMTEGKVTGANVSVRIDDEFMRAATENGKYTQTYPVDSANPEITKEVDAKAFWDKIIHNAWKSAEPGVLFWDTITRESLPDCYADLGFRTISTNPCGEIPLCPYDSCRLLAINLYSYVKNPFTPQAEFDFEKFEAHVRKAQRIMDDIIDLEMEKILNKIDSDPETLEVKGPERHLWEKIKAKTLKGRRTGVGTTAEGDMIAAMGLRYGTPEATDFSESVHRRLALAAYTSSVEMAKERGAFEIFDAKREENNPFMLRLKEQSAELYDDMVRYGRRNIACLTIAPTGTTSLMTRTTSGIEPVFMPVYKRRRKVNPNDANVRVDYVDETGDAFEEYVVYHPKFLEWMKINGIEERSDYTQEQLDELVSRSPYAGATANEIDWVEKVHMQGRIQKWVDHSISVTINLPADVTEEIVNRLYVEAWRSGCKGCTVYRDGSRSGVLVSLESKKKKSDSPAECSDIHPLALKRPIELEADVVRFQNNKEKWIAFVGLMDGRPYEIFTGLADDEDGIFCPKSVTHGKIIKAMSADGTKRYDFQFVNKRGHKTTIEGLSDKFNPEYWNYAKLISGVLRYGMPIDQVLKLVGGLDLDSMSINTWKMGVERALKKYLPNGTKASGQRCPNCGQETLIYQEGCLICTSCGTSKCG